MAEPSPLDDLPIATVVPAHRRRVSAIWIIPIVAGVVAAGIAIQRYLEEGSVVSIVFDSAEGLESGKTFVKYKEVNIGQVTAVRLSKDFGKVEVEAKIDKSAAALLVEDAKFWVVRPRVTAGGISGLGTLLSGNYIGFEGGKSVVKQRKFTGRDVAPIVVGGLAGRQFVLIAQELGSLQIGSPLYFRRLPAGHVIAYELSNDGEHVDIHVFVVAPYDRYVNAGTRFWNASGIDVAVGASGVDVRTESLAALIAGGLAFDTPLFAADSDPAPEKAEFTLHGDKTSAMKQPPAYARSYVLNFPGSVRGLSVGAPVTFLGLPAGEVTNINLTLDPTTLDVRPRVRIIIYPERLIARADAPEEAKFARALAQDPQGRHAFLRHLVEDRGMHAQLQSSSLLTGQVYVALEYFPHAPKVKVDWGLAVPELPVVPGAASDIESKLASVIDKVDKLPIEAIGTKLSGDLTTLDQALKDSQKLLGDADARVLPQLRHSLEGVDRLVAAGERIINDADATVAAPGAPAQQEFRDAMKELERTAQSLRNLTDYLEQHPESIVRGKRP